jgi:hypothetical protein
MNATGAGVRTPLHDAAAATSSIGSDVTSTSGGAAR